MPRAAVKSRKSAALMPARSRITNTLMSNPSETRDARRADAVVAGGGAIARLAVLALTRELGPGARIVRVAEAARQSAATDRRSFAIARSGRELLADLGVWAALAERAQAIGEMIITDSKLSDRVRPVLLAFMGNDVRAGGALADMVEATALNEALDQKSADERHEVLTGRIVNVEADGDAVRVALDTGDVVEASLLVAADGAQSWCRNLAGIGWIGWDYPQLGLTGTVAHERDHQGRAYEHFLAGGPFAILPLKGRRSSIVWTDDKAQAKRVLALGEAELLKEITHRMGRNLGSLRLEGGLAKFPLRFGMARSFISPRMALVGDAAHVIHPIAGQGLNMGLRDIAALAGEVGEAARLGLNIGSSHVLARYQRTRRFDTAAMGAVTDGLNRLFSNDVTLLRALRDLGLKIVDRAPALKRFFVTQAAGFRPRGEAQRTGMGKATRGTLRARRRAPGRRPS
jgi:2-octaprenyl-6-methoxyphenol hydroxylase